MIQKIPKNLVELFGAVDLIATSEIATCLDIAGDVTPTARLDRRALGVQRHLQHYRESLRRRNRPDRLAVILPSETVTTPLTTTKSNPSLYW